MTNLTDTDHIFLSSYDLPKPSTPDIANLQAMMLPSGMFILVLDNWSGVMPDKEWVDSVKEATGAAGIMVFSVPVNVIN